MMKTLHLREVRKKHPDKPDCCQRCKVFTECQSYKLPYRLLHEGLGSNPKTALLVLMNPGTDEDKEGAILVGKTGKKVMEYIQEHLADHNVYGTNAVKCFTSAHFMTKTSKIPSTIVRFCNDYLKEDIAEIKPDIIVAMGETAQEALDYLELPCERIDTYHPAYALRGGSDTFIHNMLDRTDATLKDELVHPPLSNNLDQLLYQLEHTKQLGLDFEWNVNTNKINTVGFATEGSCVARPWSKDMLNLCRKLLARHDITIYGHDLARAELRKMLEYGVESINCKFKDSMVMTWELVDRAGNVALKDIAYKKLNMEHYWKDIDSDSYLKYSKALGDYCAKDAWSSLYYVSCLEEDYAEELSAMQRTHDLDMRMLLPTAVMMHRGIGVDVENVHKHRMTIGKELPLLEQEIREQYNIEPSKVADIKQVCEFEFLTKLKNTQKEVLQAVIDETDNMGLLRFLEKVLHYREMSTLYSRYLTGLPDLVDEAGVLHAYIQVSKTNTGRPAASSPNILNLPARVRNMFMSKFGEDGVLTTRDRSQSEYRCAAYLSNNKSLLQSYEDGVDMHTWAADITGIERTPAKTLNFGALYYARDAKLLSVLVDAGLTMSKAKTALRKYRNALSDFSAWQKKLIDTSKQQGYVESPYGRRGYRLKPTNIVNFPVQSWSADLNKESLIFFFEEMRTMGLASHVWLDFYDGIETDELKEESHVIDAIAQDCFSTLPDVFDRGITLDFPMDTKSHGKHWGA